MLSEHSVMKLLSKENKPIFTEIVRLHISIWSNALSMPLIRAREIVGFAGFGPIFETENRFLDKS